MKMCVQDTLSQLNIPIVRVNA